MMHHGPDEPDNASLVRTLRAISRDPTVFSPGAIAMATAMAADVIFPPTPPSPPVCDGQLSILDVEAQP